ncbi:helix-turn-helix transcriptional regulator, partial [Micrococcus luteus]|uniref:helix-turn-helix domain-containing protein n=1 Tax=Micrococcus luteus TaxID=1270 RepID=UPI0034246A78
MDGQAAGRFLRAVRDGRDPRDFGLSTRGRRTSGLRRSEVAELAHISVEHYTNVERARGAAPSEQVVAAIADALRLSVDERRHLFQLVGRSVPLESAPSMEVAP